jgi:hypothetical protein
LQISLTNWSRNWRDILFALLGAALLPGESIGGLNRLKQRLFRIVRKQGRNDCQNGKADEF